MAALQPQAAERQGDQLHPATAGQGVLQQADAAAPTAPAGDTGASGAAPAPGTSGGSAGGPINGGSAESSGSLPPPPGGPCAPDSNGAGSTHSAHGSERRGERQTAPLLPDAGTSPSAGTPVPGPGDGSNANDPASTDEGRALHSRWDGDRSGAPKVGVPTRDDAGVGDGGGRGLTVPLLPGGSSDAGADDAPRGKGSGSEGADDKRAPWAVTAATLLSLSLGWGLWLMPQGFARLGWVPAVRPASPLCCCISCMCAPLCGGNQFVQDSAHAASAVPKSIFRSAIAAIIAAIKRMHV